MRLSTLPLLVAGAGLVGASPLSVLISSTDMSAVRLGHPAAMASVPAATPAAHPEAGLKPTRMRHLCKSMKSGVVRIFGAFGLANVAPPPVTTPVDIPSEVGRPAGVTVKFGKLSGMGAETDRDNTVTPVRYPQPIIVHHSMHGSFHRGGPFVARVHRALMMLGPWEGRAVAFVLGCGIGVLLRMFWVLAILTIRVIKGAPREPTAEAMYAEVVFDDAEDLVVPPPQYTDEKVAQAVLYAIPEEPQTAHV
ncbi:hypothetical protein DENSPDRAFT_932475 [Dentipellis sp. KUC8613]|nr:hypothetical protein DENSPDRAFT_932475 [Dentipellis sp. KUC8613]